MGKCMERLYNGIVKENPTFVLMLGMCPTLAVTTSAVNGLGMGLSTTAVLIFSNLIIALLRNIIPDRVRIPAFIVIVASLVTIVQLLIQGYLPSLYTALGVYIPLIVVNCIILGRAEAYASKNDALSSAFDGLGMGLGFTIALTCIGAVREILGSGGVLDLPLSRKISAFPSLFWLQVLSSYFLFCRHCRTSLRLRLPQMVP
ncbi:electron transport complex, RnfABCDGE type, E subunit [butyrate-producing bacterium SM4/1]|nr:electron transport complex, RnfABCDGE type, E subunit [butyrate-producing bacterium SM4/1]